LATGVLLSWTSPSWALRDVSSELEQDVLELYKMAGNGGHRPEHHSRRFSRQPASPEAVATSPVGSRPAAETARAESAEPVAVGKVPADDSTCFVDNSGYSGGCKMDGCSCPALQHCYPKFSKDDGDQDVGVCGLAMWFMSLISAVLFGTFVFGLMVMRSCLQYEDKTRELVRESSSIRARARRSQAQAASRGNTQQAPDG
ncbi:unnamed protein product, partial [Symbiodinium pilosum]